MYAQVAASFDKTGFKYKPMYHLQGSRQEMIEDLDVMMKELLEFFQKNNGVLPWTIVYYRDGVSEGQFTQVSATNLGTRELSGRASKFYSTVCGLAGVAGRTHRFEESLFQIPEIRTENHIFGRTETTSYEVFP